MMRLLSIEWLKISKYVTFWVLAGLFVVLLLLWNWSISSGVLKLGGGSDFNFISSNYSYPAVWDNVAYWTKFFSGLLSIVIIILTTNEFQYRTNRQNVIDGWKRQEFYHAKWLVVVSLSLVVTLFTMLLGVFFAFTHGAPITGFTNNISKMGSVFILTLNYFGFALLLSLLLKRSGVAIIIFLLYCYVVEIMLQQLLNWKMTSHPGDLLPLQCSAELISFPLADMLKKMSHKTGPSQNILACASIGWIAIYYIAGRIQMLKSNW